jgi:single-strand DNA-binding protein
MKNGINKTQILGNVGKTPEMKYTGNGTAITTFSVAVNHTYRDGQGQVHEDTEWFAVAAWGKLGEIANQYLDKGSRVFVEGRLKTRSWEQDGVTRYKTELVAKELHLLDGRRAADAEAADDGDEAEGFEDLPF